MNVERRLTDHAGVIVGPDRERPETCVYEPMLHPSVDASVHIECNNIVNICVLIWRIRSLCD